MTRRAHPQTGPANLRGIGLMVFAMAIFAVADALIKTVARDLPIAQIILVMGLGGALIFGLLARARNLKIWSRAFLTPTVLIRNLSEIVGTVGFVTALMLIPISTASAILQATPLLVTLGAAVFLHEPIGRRRWGAVVLGLVGVLVIIRPGLSDFDAASLYAVVGVIGLSGRDLATRAVPHNINAVVLSAYGFAVMVPAGAVMLWIGPPAVAISVANIGMLAAIIVMAVIAYYAITTAMRTGDVGAVTPFRYSRLIFAMFIGIVFFQERPDGWTLIGATIVIGSGLYAFAREQSLAKPQT